MTASKSADDAAKKTNKPAKKDDLSIVEDAAKALAQLTASLDDETRESLGALGFVVPSGDITKAIKGEFSLGYRCPYCNKVALYFVGESWEGGGQLETNDGEFRDVPPLHLPIDKIAWTQKGKSASQINRHDPQCQNCSTRVVLGAGRRLKSRFIVPVKWFEERRDESFDRKKLRDLMRDQGGAESVGGLSSNYNDPRDRPSQFMSEQEKAEITHLDQTYGAMEGMRQALGRK